MNENNEKNMELEGNETINNSEEPVPESGKKCAECGAELQEGQLFCHGCGAKVDSGRAEEMAYCQYCGAKVEAAQVFCPQCGKKLVPDQKKDNEEAAQVDKKKGKKKRRPLKIVIIILVIVIAYLIVSNIGTHNFKKMYSDIASESWCTIGSDGSYITIDTNPLDIDDHFDTEAYDAIQRINSDLGFSESVLENMGHTRAMDGTQTAESSRAVVTWRYHPDTGMEVTYSWK